jgi:MerR family transcriptional regulator, light-induced transcriptional regulator
MSDSHGRIQGERIATASKALGIPVPTIRSWERRYGFPAPPRTDGLHRRYSPVEIAQLGAVRDLITRGERARVAIEAVRGAGAPLPPAGRSLDAFATAVDAFDATRLRAVLDHATSTIGAERAITDVAMPAMRSIGLRWEAGRLDTAAEHLATEVVRTWLGSIERPPSPAGRPVLLACPPGERHTLGLEAFAVLLARRQVPARSLGADTPEASILAVVRRTGARGVVVTAHRNVVRRSAVSVLAAIDRVAPSRSFYAGNAFVTPRARVGVAGTYLGEDLLEAAALIRRTLTPRRERV